MMMLTRCERKM